MGYGPQVFFIEGLKNTLKWFDSNWDNISKDAEFPPGMSSAVKNYVLAQEPVDTNLGDVLDPHKESIDRSGLKNATGGAKL